ncbi:MAG: hypothetical protein ABFR90_03550 [Planctomycetota bacterium]
MNEKSKIEIEELLSALVDDEASERQKNEFIRLVQHDPSIADRLAFMQRQKQTLAALPVESAPDSLVEDICSALERKQILGDVPGAEQTTVTGVSHLFMRRVLTTAAMLLIPIGLLSFVVYEIIKPPSGEPVNYPPTGSRMAQGNPAGSTEPKETVLVKDLPFDGVLTFRTDQPMAVSNYTEKMIFDQGLVSFTVPRRTADVTTYQITAPPEKIGDLVESLKNVWPHCRQVALSVAGQVPGHQVDIPNVQTEQIKTLALEDSRDMLTRLAGQYAVANTNKDSAFAMGTTSDPLDSPPLTIPIPTGKDKTPPAPIDPSRPTIQLRIHVERVAE